MSTSLKHVRWINILTVRGFKATTRTNAVQPAVQWASIKRWAADRDARLAVDAGTKRY